MGRDNDLSRRSHELGSRQGLFRGEGIIRNIEISRGFRKAQPNGKSTTAISKFDQACGGGGFGGCCAWW